MIAHNLDELYYQLDSEDPVKRREAADRLARMGEAGARTLVRALRAHPWPPAGKPDNLHVHQRISKQADEKPIHAARALSAIGRPAVSEITALLCDARPTPRTSGWLALYLMNPYDLQMAPGAAQIAEALTAWLSEGDAQWYVPILTLLSRMGDKAQAAAPALDWLYHQFRPEAREWRKFIAETLLKINPPAEAIASVVLDYLRASERKDLESMFRSIYLSELSAPLTPVLPFIIDFIRRYGLSEDYYERRDAENAANTLGSIGAPAQNAILELARDEDDKMVEYALTAMQVCGWRAYPAAFFDFLLQRLKHRDPMDKSYRKEDTILSETKDRYGLPPAVQAQWDATRVKLDARFQAKWAERKHPRPTAPELARLIEELAQDASDQRKDALEKIAQYGPAALEHEPDLVARLAAHLRESDEDVLCATIHALGRLGPHARAAAPQLMRIAESALDARIFTTARQALACIAWG